MTKRLTFGGFLTDLSTGFTTIPICLGIFCFSEMFRNIGQKKAATYLYKDTPIKRLTVIKNILLKKPVLFLKSTFIGIVVGILPGVGGATAIFVSYGEAKRSSKQPELFGKGNPDGIIAAESANNALVGGALVPMLALGIPGSPTVAIIGATLTMHGLICGPELFVKRPEIAYTFMYGMLLTVVAMAIIGAFGIKYFSYILKFKMKYIIPVVLVFAMFGAYSLNNSLFDVFVAVAFGIIGVVCSLMEIPMAPLIIGVVLSPLIELNMRRGIQMANAANMSLPLYMLGRPLCIVLFIIMIAAFLIFFLMRRKGLDVKKLSE
jgi:putative tricarboxylic transport membrane protein